MEWEAAVACVGCGNDTLGNRQSVAEAMEAVEQERRHLLSYDAWKSASRTPHLPMIVSGLSATPWVGTDGRWRLES